MWIGIRLLVVALARYLDAIDAHTQDARIIGLEIIFIASLENERNQRWIYRIVSYRDQGLTDKNAD
jgi:hypothetical protein